MSSIPFFGLYFSGAFESSLSNRRELEAMDRLRLVSRRDMSFQRDEKV